MNPVLFAVLYTKGQNSPDLRAAISAPCNAFMSASGNDAPINKHFVVQQK
jgi:hypothetical protein